MLLTNTITAQIVNAINAADNAIASIVELCVRSARPVECGMLSSKDSVSKQMRQRGICFRLGSYLFDGGTGDSHCWQPGSLPLPHGTGSRFGFSRSLS
jgi:hypothetical protein